MAEVVLEGIRVQFPFKPYDVQKKYMETVIRCLNEKTYGVLESPTGTGKTLSLLCSSLAWLEHQRIFPGTGINEEVDFSQDDEDPINWGKGIRHKIIYASRTHSQLSQVMRELSRTAYKHMKTTILSSRDQTCIHPTVRTEDHLAAKNSLCKMLMKKRACRFGSRVEKVAQNPNFMVGVIDIEDLVKKCEKDGCCPFFLSREFQNSADIVFMPYNYLFDRHIRSSLGIQLRNAIIILDEAHNINKVCEESESVSFSSQDIAVAISFVTEEMQTMNSSFSYETDEDSVERDYGPEDLMFVKASLMSIEAMLEKLVLEELSNTTSKTYLGSQIFSFLQLAGITDNSQHRLVEVMCKIYETASVRSEAWQSSFPNRSLILEKLSRALTVIFESKSNLTNDCPSVDSAFRVYLCLETPDYKNKLSSKVVTVNYWCLNAGFGMSSLLGYGVHSLIVTSGTLSPVNLTASELAIRSHCEILENSHVILKSQVLLTVIPKGPRNTSLLSNFQSRGDKNYWQELALTIMNLMRVIPGGVLLFFPSYAAMDAGVESWKVNGLWNKLIAIKPFFLEPRKKTGVESITTEYLKAIKDKKGGVLMGVCRGKFSEGIDFNDDSCRAVIITGLPYPPFKDPKVVVKKEYCDQKHTANKEEITGHTWYELEALRAVNQAIGRVIRHSKDYGCILLCDEKFTNKRILKQLSKWLQNKICIADNTGEAVKLVRNFFRSLECATFLNDVKLPQNSDLNEPSSTCSGEEFSAKTDNQTSSKTLPSWNLPSTSSASTFSLEKFMSQSFSQSTSTEIKDKRPVMRLAEGTASTSSEPSLPVANEPSSSKVTTRFSLSMSNTSIPDIIKPAKKKKQCNDHELVSSQALPGNQKEDAVYYNIRMVLLKAKNIFDDETYAIYRDIVKTMEYTGNIQQALDSLKSLFPPEDTSLRNFFKDSSVFFEFKPDRQALFNSYLKKYYS